MTYLLAAVAIPIAVVLFIFTGIWGGLVWIAVAGLALAVIFLTVCRETTVERTRVEPTGTPRKARGGTKTANERVGQT